MQLHSGKFVLRVPSTLHKELATRAHKEGVSLNSLCLQLIAMAIHGPVTQPSWKERLAPAIEHLHKQYNKDLLGIIAFGSRITGTATEGSDLDLLVVLDSKVSIRRSLYREWDNNAPQIEECVLDPHFTHLPGDIPNAGAVWLEAASSGEIVDDPQHQVQKILDHLKQPIASGKVRRGWSHGHPYWTRSDDEKY